MTENDGAVLNETKFSRFRLLSFEECRRATNWLYSKSSSHRPIRMPGSFWLRISSDFESPTRLRKAYTFRSKRQDARRFYRFVCERRFLRWAQSTAKSDQLFVLLSAAILKSALWNVSGHAKAPLSKSHHSLFKSELLIQKSDSADSNDSTTLS